MIRSLWQNLLIPREDDGGVRFDDIMEECKAKFDGTSQWPTEAWITFLAKGGGPKKRFECCSNPNSSKHFLYFRAIQGHSGGNIVDPAFKDNVLLPEDFTEYICHIGNAIGLHSVVKSGLIPGGRSLKSDRQLVFFTAVNPMDETGDLKEVQYDLTQYVGAIWSSLTENDCSFIKLDHTQSFSTTHCLRFVLRKRYAWILRRSNTTKYTNLQGCFELHWSRSRKVDNRINLIKKQENPQSTKAHREVTGKPAAATSTIEYQAHLTLQSNNRTRFAEKRSKSWFSSSRITRTRSLSYRTWIRPKRWTRSAKSRRSWSPTLAIPRSSSFAKPHPRNNAPFVLFIWILALCTAHAEEEVFNPRLINSRLRHQEEPHQ